MRAEKARTTAKELGGEPGGRATGGGLGGASPYNEAYYQTSCGPLPYARTGHWLSFFSQVADEIVRTLHPGRVLDAGCAMGMLVEVLWDRGVEAWGIDISPYAIASVRPDMKSYCRVASLTDPIDGQYDLVTCIEVHEHMADADARLAVQRG